MINIKNEHTSLRNDSVTIIILCCIPLFMHLYVNIFAGYGYFRDELYYIKCSGADQLSFGYVDHPPFSIYILSISRLLFGESLFAVRLVPALASSLTVLFTCLMVLKLKGKTAALFISSVCVIFAPVYMGMFGFYSMNFIDIFIWSVAAYLIIIIIDNDKLSDWILLGLTLGFGLLNKIGILWLCFGFFPGLIITEKRKVLLTYKPYLCALIALLIFSPFIIWNFMNDFAHVEFIRNATSGKYSHLDFKDFILGQILNMNPAAVFVWLPGLYYFLFNKKGRKYRILSIIYLTSFAILLINGHSKAEYLAPAYTALFAGGGVFLEKLSAEKFKWLKYAVIIPVIILGIVIIPLAMPVLSVEQFISYSKKLGMAPSTSESKELSELPQHYADMFGWEELAQDVSKVCLNLSDEERKNAVVFGRNYGEAAAVDFYSNKYKLPKAVSGHNSYWIWGFGNSIGSLVIIIGGNKEDLLILFENVEQALIHTAEYSMPYENNIPIFIAKNPKVPLDKLWKDIKHFD
ncbi:MAG TPA: glycosyltransferase family 39 protein [Ignavibacteria bacterium]|nr:glycosyltransferase family 39 protein [Ignavibacteria bacterium]